VARNGKAGAEHANQNVECGECTRRVELVGKDGLFAQKKGVYLILLEAGAKQWGRAL